MGSECENEYCNEGNDFLLFFFRFLFLVNEGRRERSEADGAHADGGDGGGDYFLHVVVVFTNVVVVFTSESIEESCFCFSSFFLLFSFFFLFFRFWL